MGSGEMKSRWKRGRKKEGQGVNPFQRRWSERATLKRPICELGQLKKPGERWKSISHRGNSRGKGPGGIVSHSQKIPVKRNPWVLSKSDIELSSDLAWYSSKS